MGNFCLKKYKKRRNIKARVLLHRNFIYRKI